MYYEEAIINGVLHYRHTVLEKDWKPFTAKQLTDKLLRFNKDLEIAFDNLRTDWEVRS